MCQSTGKCVAVSVSTVLAAMLMGGVTIYSLLCFAIKNEVCQTKINNSSHEDKKNYLENLDYLIVDECSMVGQTLFVEIVDIIRDLAPNCRLIYNCVLVLTSIYLQTSHCTIAFYSCAL